MTNEQSSHLVSGVHIDTRVALGHVLSIPRHATARTLLISAMEPILALGAHLSGLAVVSGKLATQRVWLSRPVQQAIWRCHQRLDTSGCRARDDQDMIQSGPGIHMDPTYEVCTLGPSR